MGLAAVLDHLLNFAVPALALAVLLPALLRWTPLGRRAAIGLLWQMLLLALVNLTLLAGGWAWFGRDGAMVTYLAMVLASASVLWVLCKAWRP